MRFAAAAAASAAVVVGATLLARRARRVRTHVRAFYLLHEADADEVSYLKQAAAVEGIDVTWGFALADAPADADVNVVIMRLPSAEVLDMWTSLRWVVVPFAGPTEKTRQLVRERPHLSLHNAHFNAQSTSELAVGLLLAATKRIVTRDATLRHEAREAVRAWTPGWIEDGSLAVPTLGGRVALILGYGAIGTRVARALHGLGMEVHACRRRASGATFDGIATVHGMGSLNELLPRAFALVVALPGTAATDKLLGARELGRLPRGAVLVNVGRGSVVDEHALYDALRLGHLGSAGLGIALPHKHQPTLHAEPLGRPESHSFARAWCPERRQNWPHTHGRIDYPTQTCGTTIQCCLARA